MSTNSLKNFQNLIKQVKYKGLTISQIEANEVSISDTETDLFLLATLSDARVGISINREKNNKKSFVSFLQRTQDVSRCFELEHIAFWTGLNEANIKNSKTSEISEVTIESTLIDITNKKQMSKSIEICFATYNDIKSLQPINLSKIEGAQYQKVIHSYERSAILRSRAIELHGVTCIVCGLKFSNLYGPIGEGFIHIHHLEKLADSGEKNVDPKTDLVPVCPNCHAMLHKEDPPMSPEALTKLMEA